MISRAREAAYAGRSRAPAPLPTLFHPVHLARYGGHVRRFLAPLSFRALFGPHPRRPAVTPAIPVRCRHITACSVEARPTHRRPTSRTEHGLSSNPPAGSTGPSRHRPCPFALPLLGQLELIRLQVIVGIDKDLLLRILIYSRETQHVLSDLNSLTRFPTRTYSRKSQ